jgi:hypothetical protein
MYGEDNRIQGFGGGSLKDNIKMSCKEGESKDVD